MAWGGERWDPGAADNKSHSPASALAQGRGKRIADGMGSAMVTKGRGEAGLNIVVWITGYHPNQAVNSTFFSSLTLFSAQSQALPWHPGDGGGLAAQALGMEAAF